LLAAENGEAAKIARGWFRGDLDHDTWTIPHNRGLAFHPDYEYVVIATEKGMLLLAADALPDSRPIATSSRLRNWRFQGRDFEGMKSFSIRFCRFSCRLVGRSNVNAGSGKRHSCSGAGATVADDL